MKTYTQPTYKGDGKEMLTILIGKSGSGKDAVQRQLCGTEHERERFGEFLFFERIITTTTRPMREKEQEGIDYNFISKEDFLKGIKEDRFIEYRSYDTLVNNKPDTWYYGTPKRELDKDKDYVIILDAQGAKDFVNHYGRENCFVVSIEVPDEIRERRAMKRGSFDKTEWNRRLADDKIKFSEENIESVANFHTENTGTLDIVLEDINNALKSYKKMNKEAGKQYIVQKNMI